MTCWKLFIKKLSDLKKNNIFLEKTKQTNAKLYC